VCTDPEGNGHRGRWTTPTGRYGEPRKTITQWPGWGRDRPRRAPRRHRVEQGVEGRGHRAPRLGADPTHPQDPAHRDRRVRATALVTARYEITHHRVDDVATDLLGTTTPGYGQPDPTVGRIEQPSTKGCEVIALAWPWPPTRPPSPSAAGGPCTPPPPATCGSSTPAAMTAAPLSTAPAGTTRCPAAKTAPATRGESH